MTDNDHAAPTPAGETASDLRGPVRGVFQVRVTVHDPPASWQGPVPELPRLADANDLIRFQFEALTGCPVGVTSERTDK